jgi:hypothetical protein
MLLDHEHAHTGAGEGRRGGEPGRPCPNNDHVIVVPLVVLVIGVHGCWLLAVRDVW